MLYRPNFCCNCGEKIERTDWKLSTSRKFCDLCQSDLRFRDLAPKVGVVIALLVGIAAISNAFRPGPPPKLIASELVKNGQLPAQAEPQRNLNATQSLPVQSQPGTNANTTQPAAAQPETRQSVNALKNTDAVYYCGAATKKGTPCSRRVKHPGERCWQHTGMPSIADPARKQ